jgi:hypothetical protein
LQPDGKNPLIRQHPHVSGSRAAIDAGHSAAQTPLQNSNPAWQEHFPFWQTWVSLQQSAWPEHAAPSGAQHLPSEPWQFDDPQHSSEFSQSVPLPRQPHTWFWGQLPEQHCRVPTQGAPGGKQHTGLLPSIDRQDPPGQHSSSSEHVV